MDTVQVFPRSQHEVAAASAVLTGIPVGVVVQMENFCRNGQFEIEFNLIFEHLRKFGSVVGRMFAARMDSTISRYCKTNGACCGSQTLGHSVNLTEHQ